MKNINVCEHADVAYTCTDDSDRSVGYSGCIETWTCRGCGEVWDNPADIPATDCAGCGERVSENASITCSGCDEVFCAGHLVKYDGELACPACVKFWADEAMKQLQELLEERMEARMNTCPDYAAAYARRRRAA